MRNKNNNIRICKLVPVAQAKAHWGLSHSALLSDIAHPGVEVVERDLPGNKLTAITSNYDADLVAPAHVTAALKAEADGFDAVIIECLLEPGLSAAREALKIPVIGDTGAALHLASLVARRFSILLPGTRSAGSSRPIRDLVAIYGFSDHIASYRPIGVNTLEMGDHSDERSLDATLQEGRLASEQDGAEAIIGYGGMKIIQALRDELPIPIISPVQASVLIAEMLAQSHLSHSKIAFPYPETITKT